jgi:hypothetical protein
MVWKNQVLIRLRREFASPCKASETEAASQCFVPDSRFYSSWWESRFIVLAMIFVFGLRERVQIATRKI